MHFRWLVVVLVANFEFAGLTPKQKYTDCCKILTEKEPIRAQGFAGFAI